MPELHESDGHRLIAEYVAKRQDPKDRRRNHAYYLAVAAAFTMIFASWLFLFTRTFSFSGAIHEVDGAYEALKVRLNEGVASIGPVVAAVQAKPVVAAPTQAELVQKMAEELKKVESR